MTSLVLLPAPTVLAWNTPQAGAVASFAESWLESLADKTRSAYRDGIFRFSRLTGIEAPIHFLALADKPDLHQGVLRFRSAARGAGLSPATINQTLTAVKSVLRVLRSAGLTSNELLVKNERSTPYRDTKGPPLEAVGRMLAQCGDDAAGRRDAVIIWLMAAMGLRRGEVASLRLEDVQGDALAVRSKGGGGEPIPLTMPLQVREAIGHWLAARPPAPKDALLVRLDNPAKGLDGLSPRGIDLIVRSRAAAAGCGILSPHKLRHCAITAALDATDGDVRSVRLLSRHKSVETVLVYDDRRADLGGKISQLVAAKLDLARAV